jgi:hypothetical protein
VTAYRVRTSLSFAHPLARSRFLEASLSTVANLGSHFEMREATARANPGVLKSRDAWPMLPNANNCSGMFEA